MNDDIDDEKRLAEIQKDVQPGRGGASTEDARFLLRLLDEAREAVMKSRKWALEEQSAYARQLAIRQECDARIAELETALAREKELRDGAEEHGYKQFRLIGALRAKLDR